MAAACDLCHRDDDSWDPFIGSSNGTASSLPIGCVGCHGRDYGLGVGHSGVGLRAHHAFAGVETCVTCHDQDPAPLPEYVAPSYYGGGDADVDDPCNEAPNYRENWSVGDTLGLDNDGDGLYDAADPDCNLSIPAVSPWGMAVMSILVLAAGAVLSLRRGQVSTPGPASR